MAEATTTALTIDAGEVEEALKDCLFGPGEDTTGFVPVEGVVRKFGLHPQRLEAHREQVTTWLGALPEEFREGKGGGWSFLQACNQANGLQWTGLHQTMEALFVLAIGLGLAKYLLPRELWASLPGGMPYIAILPAVSS